MLLPPSPLQSSAGYGQLHRLLVQPTAQALLGSGAAASLSTAAGAQLCSGWQACILLAAFASIGCCLYMAELRERRAFLAALPSAPITPAPAQADPRAHKGTAHKDGEGDGDGSSGGGVGGGSSAPPRRPPVPTDLACASEYWLSFALPAVCGLYTYSVAGQ